MINGFQEAMRDIFAYLSTDTQVCLISATMPKEVLEITEQFMKDPIKILLEKKEVPVKGIKQFFIALKDNSQKFGTLIQLYKNLEIGQCIVFVNTKDRAI
jgi:superfamily II DNA/RNA helicase